MRILTLAVLSLTGTLAYAESYEELIDSAFASMELNLRDHWAYTETSTDDDGTSVARHDPRRLEGERWVLASVDGRAPTEDELEDFDEEKNRDRDSDSDDEDDNSMNRKSLVEDGSLELLEETDTHWLFAFKPVADDEDNAKFLKKVDGTLTVIKDGHYVGQIRMQNSKPIKPGKGVKLEVFNTQLDFAPITEGGPALPQTINTHVKGRAMLLISFNEKAHIEYSDFQKVVQ